jgi:YHS domain-containing protein
MSGNDPVLAIDRGQTTPGRREHGVFFENRIYLFSSEATLEEFRRNPRRYAAEVLQARR